MRLMILMGLLLGSTVALANPSIRFSVITTGNSAGSLEAMVVSGGGLTEIRSLVHPAVLIEHESGSLLWDTGLGSALEEQMQVFGWLDKQLFKVENHKPALEQLRKANYPIDRIQMVIPSHMHWDHVSGLEDFIPKPVWVQQQSYDEAVAGAPPGFVFSQFDDSAINWNFIELNDGAYEGFARSLDIFGDGSVVLVDTSGHSHGHLGLFLNMSERERYFFIGDTTWVLEGIERNASRPWIVNALVGVDADVEQNAGVIAHMHALAEQKPEIVFVPAHDERVVASLPAFPAFSDGK